MGPRVTRVMSIDPGSTSLGLAILDINCATLEIKLVHVYTFHIDVVVKYGYGNFEFLFGIHAARLAAIRDIITNMAFQWHVDDVTSEAPYMGRFPRAFEVLTQCMCYIRNGLSVYYGDRPLVTFDPATVKSCVGVKGTSSDKLAVANALLYLPRLDITGFDISTLDEHSTDAIAVGYTYAKRMLGC